MKLATHAPARFYRVAVKKFPPGLFSGLRGKQAESVPTKCTKSCQHG